MVFRPLDGGLTPEEQKAALMERLNAGDLIDDHKPGVVRRTGLTTLSNTRSPDQVMARTAHRRAHCQRMIQARKDALDLSIAISEDYRSPMNRHGFLHEMLSPVGVDDEETQKNLAHTNLKMHEETSEIKEKRRSARASQDRLRGGGQAMILKLRKQGAGLMGVMGAAMKKKAQEEQAIIDKEESRTIKQEKKEEHIDPRGEKDYRDMTSRERAMKFYRRTQRLAGKSNHSPAFLKMKADKKRDVETARANMKISGDADRLIGLKHKKRPDAIETKVLDRLEAKYMGLVFVAEVKRKERDKAEFMKARMARVKAIEAQDRENREDARLKRNKRLRDMAGYAGVTWGGGARANRRTTPSTGLGRLAAPSLRKRSIRLPGFKTYGAKPAPLEKVVEDAPQRNVRQFMRGALRAQGRRPASPPEDDDRSVGTLDSAAATIGSHAYADPRLLEGAEEEKEGD